jgi:hypothetical protein
LSIQLEQFEMPRIRPAKPDDIDYIEASWMNSYEGCQLRRGIKEVVYKQGQRQLIRSVLKFAKLTISVTPEDDDVILGYTVTTPGVLHYAFVKPSMRNNGICRSLVAAAGLDFETLAFTSITKPWRDVYDGHKRQVYNPYKLMEELLCHAVFMTEQHLRYHHMPTM